MAVLVAFAWPAAAHDIYAEMTKDTACSCTGKECEPVEVVPAFCSPDKGPADWPTEKHCTLAGDGAANAYYLPISGEWLWAAMARASSDDRFHRCVWPPNRYWNGKGWTVLPNNSTLDGKPPTRCFFAPNVGY